MAVEPDEFGPGGPFQAANPDYYELTPQQQVMRGYAWASDPDRPAPEGAQWGGWERLGAGGAPNQPAPGGNDQQLVNQFMQWLTQAAGGGGGLPGGNFGGGNPMLPVTPDALGMGAGADPLGMGFPQMQGGLFPDQIARLTLRRNNEMNALRQNMANMHRGPGRDFSRHVQNIDNAIEQLAMQDTNKNIDQMIRLYGLNQQIAQQRIAGNNALMDQLTGAYGRQLRYGKGEQEQEEQSPGTYSGGETDAGS